MPMITYEGRYYAQMFDFFCLISFNRCFTAIILIIIIIVINRNELRIFCSVSPQKAIEKNIRRVDVT